MRKILRIHKRHWSNPFILMAKAHFLVAGQVREDFDLYADFASVIKYPTEQTPSSIRERVQMAIENTFEVQIVGS